MKIGDVVDQREKGRLCEVLDKWGRLCNRGNSLEIDGVWYCPEHAEDYDKQRCLRESRRDAEKYSKLYRCL